MKYSHSKAMAVLHKIVKLVKKALLSKHILGKQVMIVTNTTVAPLYLAKVRALLSA
jgi:3-dehydroquinate synthetase